MKDKVITFIIGALVGAIITAGVFFILKQSEAGPMGGPGGNMQQMQGGPGGPGGQGGNMSNGENPPKRPSDMPAQKPVNTNATMNVTVNN